MSLILEKLQQDNAFLDRSWTCIFLMVALINSYIVLWLILVL